jgi:hypothetical protein
MNILQATATTNALRDIPARPMAARTTVEVKPIEIRDLNELT